EYLGAGPGAHGRLVLESRRTATRAAAKIGDYVAAVNAAGVSFETREPLDARAAAEGRPVLGLRLAQGVGLDEVSALQLDPGQGPVRDLADAGLLTADDSRLAATEAGRLVLDRVIAELITRS